MRTFPVQQILRTADFGNLVTDFFYLQRAHLAFAIAKFPLQAQDFGIFAILCRDRRGCFIFKGIPCNRPFSGSSLHIYRKAARSISTAGLDKRIVVTTCWRNRVGRFHPVFTRAKRLQPAATPKLVAIGLIEDGVIVHEGDSLALRLGFIGPCIIVLFGLFAYQFLGLGLFAEKPHKPAYCMRNKGKMPRAEPKRKHKNQCKGNKQHNKRRQARHLPEYRNRDVLVKELPHNTAIHHHHVTAHLGITIIFERKQARKVKRQKCCTYSKTEQAFTQGFYCEEYTPQHKRNRKYHHGQLAKYKAYRFGNQLAEIRA